jgi:DNA-binding MarR family transcriptional regulator
MSSSPDLDDVFVMAEAMRPALLRLSRKLRGQSRDVGMSPMDVFLLIEVGLNPGLGVCELADREQVARPTMSVHVKRLEAAGWLARLAPDSDDKRRVGLVVTPAGQEALDVVRRQRTDWLAARLMELSPDARAALRGAVQPLIQLAGERV